MKELTEIEIGKAAVLKAYRAAIRLRHSLAADREISQTLPEIERLIDIAMQSGLPIELNPAEMFDATLNVSA